MVPTRLLRNAAIFSFLPPPTTRLPARPVYPIDPALPCKGYGENCLWIITEADRSVTTFLLSVPMAGTSKAREDFRRSCGL